MMCTPPYDNRTAQIEPSNTVVGNAECGCGGVCLAPKGSQAVSCHFWGVGALPPMPHGDPRC
eukprot:1284986-Prymnesium_polylepis.1